MYSNNSEGPNARRINELLRQTEHYDADERFMAVHDLISELEKLEGSLTPDQQVRIRQCIMKLLDDKSSDVSTVATKCLSMLVQRFSPEECLVLVAHLGKLIVDPNKSGSRDTWADGLKTIVASSRPEDGNKLAAGLTTNLIKGLTSGSNNAEEIGMEMICLDIMKDVLGRFALDIEENHKPILEALMPLLEHPNAELRKRANITIGALVPALQEDLFVQLMTTVISNIKQATHDTPSLFTYIQSVGVICANSPLRVGHYLEQIVPKLQDFCQIPGDDAMDTDEESLPSQIDLWENALQAFESILIRCPVEATPYVADICRKALWFVKFDPFVAQDASEEMEDADFDGGDDDWGDEAGWGDEDGDNDMAGADAGWGAELENIAQANDDDASWRVRRAAVGVLSAFIKAKHELLNSPFDGDQTYYSAFLTSIVARFKERDLNVKEEVLHACRSLLRSAVVVDKDRAFASDRPALTRQRSFYNQMDDSIQGIVDGLVAEFKGASVNIKRGIFACMRELVTVKNASGGVSMYHDSLVPVIVKGVESSDTNVKSDAVTLLLLVLKCAEANSVSSHLDAIARVACDTVQTTSHPKTKADSLKLIGAIVEKLEDDQSSMLKHLFECLSTQLLQRDADQAVKETSISSMSTLIYYFGPQLQGRLQDTLQLLVERLGNQVTRIAALNGFAKIATSDADIDVSPILKPDTISTIAGFLRKASTDLRHAAATTLEVLVRTHASLIEGKTFTTLIEEVAPYVSEADLQLSHLVLDLLSSIVHVNPSAAVSLATAESINRILQFTRCPLLQGASLNSLKNFYKAIVNTDIPVLSYESLTQRIQGSLSDVDDYNSLKSASECIAAMTGVQPNDEISKVVEKFRTEVEGKEGSSSVKTLALLVLGEIGSEHDLDEYKSVDSSVFAAFDSSSPSVKNAAAYALGCIVAGNLNSLLGSLLNKIQNSDAQRYLLFTSLKEVISQFTPKQQQSTKRAPEDFLPRVKEIQPILFDYADSKDEGVRDVTSECLGRAAVICTDVFGDLADRAGSSSNFMRSCVINSLRVSMSAEHQLDTSVVLPLIPKFLALLHDADLDVKRQSILTINTIANTHIELIIDVLKDTIVPKLYQETHIDKSLIKEVDYGAFKEVVDHGVPIRRAAFLCLATLLEEAPEKLNLQEFIQEIKRGMDETSDDVLILVYNILRTLADKFPNALLEAVDGFPPSITKSLKPKFRVLKGKEGPEHEKATQACQVIVGVVYYIMDIPGANQCTKFAKFFDAIKATGSLKNVIESVEESRKQK